MNTNGPNKNSVTAITVMTSLITSSPKNFTPPHVLKPGWNTIAIAHNRTAIAAAGSKIFKE